MALARVIVRSLLVAVAIAIVVVLAVDFGWQRDRIVGLTLDFARDRLATDIDVDRVTGRLSSRVTLHGLRIGSPKVPLVEVERLDVRWRPLSLLLGDEWIADVIRIRGWRLDLRRDREGRWIAIEDWIERLGDGRPDEEGSPTEGPGPSLLVRRIELAPGAIDVRLEVGSGPGTEKDARHPGGERIAAEPTTVRSGSARGSLHPGPWRARWQARGRLRELAIGPGRPLAVASVDVSAQLEDASGPGAELEGLRRAELDLRLEGPRIVTARAVVEAQGLAAQADADGSLEHIDRLDVSVEARSLASIAPWLPQLRPLAGAGRLEASLSGPPEALTGHIALELADARIDRLRAGRLALDTRYERPLAQLLEDPQSFEGTLSLEAEGLDPGPLAPDWLPPGAARLALRGEARNRRVVLERFDLEHAGLAATGRLRVGSDRIDLLEADFTLDDVAPWIAGLAPEREIGGRVDGRVRLAGPWRRPRGRIQAETEDLRIGEEALGPARLDASSRSSAGGDARAPIDVVLRWGRAEAPLLEVEMEVDLVRERAAFHLLTRRALVERLVTDDPLLLAEVDARGVATREGDGVRLELPVLEVRGESARLALDSPLEAHVASGGRWSFATDALRLARPHPAGEEDQEGIVSIALAGEGRRPVRLELALEEMPIALLVPPDTTLPALDGRLSGGGRWQAERRGAWTQGRLEWADVKVDQVSLDRIGLEWSGRDSGLEAAIELALGEIRPLGIDAVATLPPEVALWELSALQRHTSLRTELDRLDLAVLAPFVPRGLREVTGVASGSLALAPGVSGWSVEGRLDVEGGGFTVPALRQRFAPVELHARLGEGRVDIERLRIGPPGDGASLEASVELDRERGYPLSGALRLDRLLLRRARLVETRLDGEVRLDGSLDAPVVRGELALDDTRVRVPAADDPIRKEIRILTRDRDGSLTEVSRTDEPPIFGRADVDVSLSAPPTTRIRGQEANLFVEGRLQATRAAGEPLRLRGEANVVNGTYTFQGRRFFVRRGTVRLAGDEQVDPLLDIEAHHRVGDILAIVEVSGRLSAPLVRLRSEPPLPERDVLAYVIFGRPAEEIGAAQGSRFDAAAARIVAGVAERELREVLGDAMPIDTIEIGADETGATSELGFGKYLGPDLYLRYVHVLGDEPADRVGVEYRLNDLFSIGSSVSTTGDAGLDLILRQDF